VSVVPDTEQIPLLDDAKETVSPEDAVAERVKGPAGRVRGMSGSKVMVWDTLVMV
jgi:hypothetical protein